MRFKMVIRIEIWATAVAFVLTGCGSSRPHGATLEARNTRPRTASVAVTSGTESQPERTNIPGLAAPQPHDDVPNAALEERQSIAVQRTKPRDSLAGDVVFLRQHRSSPACSTMRIKWVDEESGVLEQQVGDCVVRYRVRVSHDIVVDLLGPATDCADGRGSTTMCMERYYFLGESNDRWIVIPDDGLGPGIDGKPGLLERSAPVAWFKSESACQDAVRDRDALAMSCGCHGCEPVRIPPEVDSRFAAT